MKVHVIFAQRKQNYPGQYALETVACMTETEADDNGDYLVDQLHTAKVSNEYESVAIVTLNVKESEIKQILQPASTVIEAAVEKADYDAAIDALRAIVIADDCGAVSFDEINAARALLPESGIDSAP